MNIVSPVPYSTEACYYDQSTDPQRADDQPESIPRESSPKQTDALEVMQGNHNLARAAHSSEKIKRSCCRHRLPKTEENKQQMSAPLPSTTEDSRSIHYSNPFSYIVSLSPYVLFFGHAPSLFPEYVDQPRENRESPRPYEDFQRGTIVADTSSLPNSNSALTALPIEELPGGCIANPTPLEIQLEAWAPPLNTERQEICLDIPSGIPHSSQPDLLDDSTWEDMPPIVSSPPTATPSQASVISEPCLQVVESSLATSAGGQIVESITRTAIEGNPALFQEAEEALCSLHAKPSGATFFVSLADGTQKEYYRSAYGLQTFLSAGQKLASACNYPTDITASLEQHMNGKTYACITFRKRIDHAQITYRELRKRWHVEEAQKALTFAVPFPSGNWKMLFDNESKAKQLEKARILAIKEFCKELHVDNVPRDPAFERIYRPSYDQRRQLLEGCPDAIEYIAATDCVLFLYKPVPVKQPLNK